MNVTSPSSADWVIVTGGAGFIGSAVVWALNQSGCDRILIVDDLSGGGDFRNLSGLRFADYLHQGAFLERMERGGPLPPCRAVIHLGACSDTTEPDAEFLMRNNFAYTRSVAGWCLSREVRCVYASSAATYGDGEAGYDDGLEALPRLRPRNAYAFSKHAFDLWAWQHGALDRLSGLKYFNVFGPNEYHKGGMRSVVLKAFEQIVATGEAQLFRSYRPECADGEQRRDFVYVKDVAAMTLWFLEHPEATGLFNIGSGTARSFNELVSAVFAALGRPARIRYVEMPENIRAGYQYWTCADMRRLRAAGCRLPARALEAAVHDYVTGYLSSGDRYLRPGAAPGCAS